jgi:hypothetical protein
MNKARKDYRRGRIAKEYSTTKTGEKKETVWCADNILEEYWDGLKKKTEDKKP